MIMVEWLLKLSTDPFARVIFRYVLMKVDNHISS
jgi:hypothetical protein